MQNYPPEKGAVRYTCDLATWLADRGDEVTVIAGLPHYPFGKPYPGFGRFRANTRVENGVTVVRVPMIMASNQRPLLRILGFLSFLLAALVRTLTCQRPDLVISSVPPVTVSLVGYFAQLFRKIPSLVILRDLEPLSSFQLRGMEGALPRLITRFFMGIYRAASRIVVIHEQQAITLRGHGIDSSRISTIPHGIDLDKFALASQVQTDNTLRRRDGRSLAVFVGTIGVTHDLERFLVMLAESGIRKLPVDFVFVGSGERLEACQEIVARLHMDHVQFVPPVALELVPSLLKQADLLVSSYSDSPSTLIGSKIVEYCAAGKPVLLHGPKTSRDHLRKIGNGWSCANGDVAGLTSALEQFVSHRERWPDLGERGREFAASHFSASERQERWTDLLAPFAHDRTAEAVGSAR